jgi:hypothetical protein
MTLDDSRFPLVFLRAHMEPISSVEEQALRNEQLEKLLDRQTSFVLLADHSTHDHDHETVEERKEKALFFKKIKDRMKKHCLGMVVIEGEKPMNGAARLAAVAASKALGFPVQFARDEEAATVQAIAVLRSVER